MPAGDDHLPVYTIRVVRALTGLTERQVRYWEELGLVRPARSPGEQRLFSPADVNRLKHIKQLKEEGLSLRAVGARVGKAAEPPAGPVPIKGAVPENGCIYEDARARFGHIPGDPRPAWPAHRRP